MPGRALSADLRVTCVLTVPIPVSSAVRQEMVFRANDAVVILIIDISPPGMPAFHGLRTLVGSGQHPAIREHFFTDMWSFIGGICHDRLDLWKTFRHFIVNIIESHAVMDIAGG